MQREVARIFPGIEITGERFSDLTQFEQPVTVTYDAAVPQLARRAGSELHLAPSTLANLVRALAQTPQRRYPRELGPPSTYVERRTVRLEQGLTVQHVPDGGEAVSPFGRVTVAYDRRADSVSIRTELEMRTDRVSVADYPAFRRWVESADALLRQRLTFGGAQ